MSLYPAFPAFTIPTVIEETSPQFYQDYLFDWDKMDFVPNNKGAVLQADGWTSWKNWCIKQAYIIRNAHLAYDNTVGIDEAYINSQGVREAQRAAIEKSITEALMVNPRTRLVTNFVFTAEGDEVYMSFTVYPVEGSAFEFSNNLRSYPW